jgi:HTH-type transcriptional regulator/antitoxin HigA
LWASDFLIPPDAAAALPRLPKTKAAVCAFAEEVGVHPGIVVGRMQHDQLIDVTWMNELKVRIDESALV